jgi:hypothetical protein
MLSLDLFDSRYERQLREGAVDDLEARRIDDLNMRMLELLDRAKEPAYRKNPDALAGLKRQFQKIKAERDSYFKINPATGMDPTGSLGTTKGKLDEVDPPQRPPAKGLLKNKDLITPQQRVAGATPAKPGVAGAVKDVAGGIKRWLKGEPDQGPTYESIDEQDNIDKFGPPQGSINPADQPASNPALSGQMVVQILANAWDDKKPYVDIPYPGGNVTMSRAKIYDVLITLRNMSESKLNKIVGSIFTDRSAFLLWSSQLKRLNTPVEKNPPTPPGQMKLFREADGQKKNLKDQDDEVDTPQNLAVQRYLTRVRRKHPAATSDVEAMAKDEMEKQATTDQTIKDLKSVNIRQDAALKKAMSLDRQQGDEIDDIEKQIDQLGQKIQIIKKGKPTVGVDANAPAKISQQPVQPSISTDTPATTRAVAPNLDRDATASAAAVVPVTDRALTDKVQNLEKQIQQNQQQGDPENKVRSLLTQLDQAQKALNTQIASLGAMQQKSDSSTQGLIDLFPKEKSTTKPRGKLKSPKQDKPEDLDLAKSLLKKFKAPAAVTEHGGGIGPRQHWQDLMQETVTDVRPLWADVYRRLAPKIERHRDSFLAGQLYDELENIAELHGAEGEFKRMMNGARNRAHMEYDTNPGGFQNWFWFLPFEDEQVNELDVNTLKSYADKRGAQVAAMKADNPNPTAGSKEWIQQAVPAQKVGRAGQKIARKERQQGMAESTDDIKKRMSKLEALALAANRAGDDAKCKMYQQKIQSLKQKLSQAMDEGWSDAIVSRRTGQPRTPYSVYINGRKWKDFENDDHAENVANKLRAKFKADGRDPETITIAPTDMSEGVKSGAAATALAACIAAGGTLSGCATNPSVGGAIGTVRDVGTAAKTASTMTRAGVQDELSQELRNFIRAQGGDPGSQNLSLLYKLQKRLQGQKDSQSINEVKDTEAVEQAIIKRIMVAHRDMLVEYGTEKIMSAASDVAYNVGDIGDMGDNDISGWVNQVRQILGVVNETKTRLDPKCWTGKKIGNPKTKVKGGVRVNNCVPAESVEEGLKDPEDNPCWKGYKPVGTKKKAGKTVPNCVPVKEATNGAQ